MRSQNLFQCRFLGRHIGPLPGAGSGTKTTKEPSNTPSSEYIGKFEVVSRVEPGILMNETFKRWILSPDTALVRQTSQFLRSHSIYEKASLNLVHIYLFRARKKGYDSTNSELSCAHLGEDLQPLLVFRIMNLIPGLHTSAVLIAI